MENEGIKLKIYRAILSKDWKYLDELIDRARLDLGLLKKAVGQISTDDYRGEDFIRGVQHSIDILNKIIEEETKD